ncbi:uncharacterized protein [Aegilops tauschii subsp. strangulata]|uniref:uncharacterized protein n=1 Tax=Aegilops tauschii subsp. strangulata TaxID=200361 RepID=UPI00098B8B66|nr:uncharacterized protein LOC109739284 [Aegilops tauschii subsp. strangulata]
MVSWSDDDSSENSHQYADSASDEGIVKIPETMDDSHFEGTEPDVLCNEHSLPAEWRVAFQGIHTGRRFLACDVKKIKLQESYERLVEDVNSLLDAQEQRAQMERGKMQNKPDESKLQEKYDMLKNLTVAQANVIRNMKLKLAEEKIKL